MNLTQLYHLVPQDGPDFIVIKGFAYILHVYCVFEVLFEYCYYAYICAVQMLKKK